MSLQRSEDVQLEHLKSKLARCSKPALYFVSTELKLIDAKLKSITNTTCERLANELSLRVSLRYTSLLSAKPSKHSALVVMCHLLVLIQVLKRV